MMKTRGLIVAIVLIAGFVTAPSLGAQSSGNGGALAGRELIIHTLSRLTFGPTGELVDEVQKTGLSQWLSEQLKHSGVDAALQKKLAAMPSLNMTAQELARAYDGRGGDRRRRLGREFNASILLRAIENDWQVAEVMTDFWRNHFNVDRGKDTVRFTAVEYDRVVLRDHVFGRFHDMLLASARHPAMLVYLDNYISRKPPTKTELKTVARRVRRKTGSKERGQEAADIAAQRGLNENYARELMELHTLGVDNGYTQKDVVELARALTGWTVDRNKQRYVFQYREEMHDGGDKFVLGRAIAREKRRNGIVEGEKIIARLAAHKNTADFLARKLAIYLLCDDPPKKFCDRMARELRKSKFDLGLIVKKIVESPEFRRKEHWRCKFKTPLEFVISALRVTDAEVKSTEALTRWLEEMGQPLYRCEDPTGYSDTAESWRDPGVMAFRWKFALDLVYGRIKGVKVPESFFGNMNRKTRDLVVIKRLGDKVLPGGLSSKTISTLMRLAKKHRDLEQENRELVEIAIMDGEKPPRFKPLPPLKRRLLAALLGSPEFQQQ